MAESSGIPPKSSMDLLARQAGGREHVGFIREDYKNYLRTKRTIQMKLGDTGGVLEYLQRMQAEDPNFSYAIEVDIDDLITNIFWADARMKLDYDRFGDVVSFDTTYRRNKEGRPFALFVGVNHHKQTVIFGGALLYDETKETFEWLFDTFAKTMSGKEPKTILTDQDTAMDIALSSKWPKTKHRLCVWHMYQNAAKHLSGVFDKFKSFAKDFSSCVYDYDEVPEFVNAWNDMIEKYNLRDNEWLNKLYGNREKWALLYGRHTFSADMSTTQRSESMNSRLKDYVSYKHDLLQFFQHFQSLLDDRRYEESKADMKSSASMPYLPYPVEILKHAASVYTLEVYKIFYQEMWKTWNCNIELLKEVETITEYKVTTEKISSHTVKFDSDDYSVSCSCKKFEFVGILCARALKIYSIKNVKRVPDRYMLKRWTKAAKVSYARLVSCNYVDDDPKVSTGRRYKELSSLVNQLAARAAEMEETYDIVVEGCNKVLEDVEKRFKKINMEKDKVVGTEADEIEEVEVSQVKNDITFEGSSSFKLDNSVIRGVKVKPKKNKADSSKRYMSALEKATRKSSNRKKSYISATTKSSQVNNNVNSSSTFSTYEVTVSNPQGNFTNFHNVSESTLSINRGLTPTYQSVHNSALPNYRGATPILQVQTPNFGTFTDMILRHTPQITQMTQLQPPLQVHTQLSPLT